MLLGVIVFEYLMGFLGVVDSFKLRWFLVGERELLLFFKKEIFVEE